jgi:hypothetical protein
MAKTTKKLNCNPGNYQCGMRCMSVKKNCRKNMPPKESESLEVVTKAIKKVEKKKVPVSVSVSSPYVKSFSELSPQEIEKIKELSKDNESILDLILTDEGQKKAREISDSLSAKYNDLAAQNKELQKLEEDEYFGTRVIEPEDYLKVNSEIQRIYKEIRDAKESFINEIDKAFLGSEEDTSKYKRRDVSQKITDRKLPQGNSNDPTDSKLQSLIDERAPMMAIGTQSLFDILESDSQDFKNVYDFDTKVGIAGDNTQRQFDKYKTERKRVEKKALNIPIKATPDQRPVYGFMGNEKDLAFQQSPDGLDSYGELVIKFKPELKDELTVTIDDSMGGLANKKSVGSPANNVSKKSLPNGAKAKINQDASDFRDILDDKNEREPRYIEWQSSGRLNLSQVESVYIPINVYYTLSDQMLEKLQSLNIKINIMPPRELITSLEDL